MLKIFPERGSLFGFPKTYTGSLDIAELDRVELESWIVVNGYPASLLSKDLKIYHWEDETEWPDNPAEAYGF
jgi:hypothetical protein